MTETTPKHRPIRSFVRREGRMTPAQQRALDELWPVYGLDLEACPLDLDAVFGRRASRTLEIGFGMGDALLAMAAAAPAEDFIGVEVHRPGVGSLLKRLQDAGITNVRVFCADAVEVLDRCLPADSLSRVCLFFPDPWHKKRHHKRRLVQPPFVERVCDRLARGGVFHLATDWEDYARHMLEVLTASRKLCNTAPDGRFVPRPSYRPETKFERRGMRLGHGVWDLVFERIG
jgi:tRNA (guanine-N7-)-methyltransferase